MTSTSISNAQPRNPWIVSAAWDLTYLVATPVAIVPVVLVAVRQWLTPEQIYLAVISFASLGHHLPGFMRAYGDHELFARYRWRFLLAPPLIFALALLFSPPSQVAAAFKLPWAHLHGLELILFIWGTWHGLMQTYGLMRIYDLRRGENDRLTARLDHSLCLAVFVAGVVFSDQRMFEIANVMWQTGLPVFGPATLSSLRWAVGAIGLVVFAAYLGLLVARRRGGVPANGIKLLLAAITGWFYWYCGRLSTNLLIGVAMFEIYHAVQYNAIVWIYNRRLFERVGEKFGPLGFLFRDRLAMLGIYLAAIASYSSIRFFTADANDRMFSGDSRDAHQWLIALFVTSSFLHFYYDGFIWKVSERRTQANLVDKTDGRLSFDRYVPAAQHAARWGTLVCIAALLILAERRSQQGDPRQRDVLRLNALAALTPNVPDALAVQVVQAQQRGDLGQAAELAREAARMRPRSHIDQARAAEASSDVGNFAAAEQFWRRAVDLHGSHWQYRVGLAEALEAQCDAKQALDQLQQAVRAAADSADPRRSLADYYVRHGRPDAAAEELAVVVRSLPSDVQARLAYGAALAADEQFPRAVAELQRAVELDPTRADAHFGLGATLLKSGDAAKAVAPLSKAVELDENHFAARLKLGDSLYALQKWSRAVDAYEDALRLRPDVADAWVNLASAQLNAGRVIAAEQTLRKGLRELPDAAELSFTLGMLLRQTGRGEESRQWLERAAAGGLTMAPL